MNVLVKIIGQFLTFSGVRHTLQRQNGVPEIVAHPAGLGKILLLILKLLFLHAQQPHPPPFRLQRLHGHDRQVEENEQRQL